MTNRLERYLEERPEPGPAEDYFEVQGRFETYYVSRDVAESVTATLARRRQPRWTSFVDLSGSAVRVRTALIDCVRESTRTQREAGREFFRARRKEAKADRRPWEEDEWF